MQSAEIKLQRERLVLLVEETSTPFFLGIYVRVTHGRNHTAAKLAAGNFVRPKLHTGEKPNKFHICFIQFTHIELQDYDKMCSCRDCGKELSDLNLCVHT